MLCAAFGGGGVSDRPDSVAPRARSLAQHIVLLAMLLLAPAMALGLLTSYELAVRLRAGAYDVLSAAAHLAARDVLREVEAELLAQEAPGAEGVVLVAGGEPPPASRPRGTAPPPASRLAAALASPALPAGAFALLLDAQGEVLAAAPAALAPAGLPGWITSAVLAGQPGPLRARGLDQTPLVLMPEPVGVAGWSVLVGQSRDRFDAAWREPTLRQAGGALLIGALGLALAVGLARRLQDALPRLAPVGSPPGADLAAPPAVPGRGVRVAEFESLGGSMRAQQRALHGEAAHAAAIALENQRLAEAAANDRLLLLSIMQSAPDPIFVKNTALRYVMVNEVAAATAGVQVDDVVGRLDTELVSPEEAARLGAQDREVMASGVSREFDRVYIHPVTGQRRLLRTLKAPWRSRTGEIIGVVGVGRDVTDREEAERRLRAAEEALRRIARADTLTIMSLGIAHELNQPLTAASNFQRAALRWLERGAEDPERLTAARGVIEEAASETLRAAEILRRLRDFIGHGETEREEIQLAPLLSETIALMRAARPGEELPVALDLAEEPCGMRADRIQLQQVFVNLLRNAVDATDGLAERGLGVSLARRGFEAVIVVSDRGPGLPPEVNDRLFEPFVSTRPQGMGIGLAISHTIVDTHGGRIAARPRAGGGTEFVVELPLWEE
jgi:two-component system sensor kinase FixL